jgi:ActR/RegA family two-component response regulator
MRLLSIRSGARLRRADSIKSARRHLRIYRPDVALIDLGLPDGSGLEIIQDIAQGRFAMTSIIATSGNINTNTYDDAINAGAAFFMEKPVADLANFQQTILASLPAEMRPRDFVPRLAGSVVKPDTQALKDDLDHIDSLLVDCFERNDVDILSYAAQFLNSLGRDANSKRILQVAEKLGDIAKGNNFSCDDVKQEFRIARKAVDNRMAQSTQIF